MMGLRFKKPKVMGFILKKPQKILMDNFFVFYPLNLYFLNPMKEVIEIKEDFKPFTFYKCQSNAAYIIESPSKLEAKKGHIIEWE